MAVVSKNPINSIFSLKNLLLSISAVFMACLLKIYAPLVFEVFVSGVPVLISLFTPPYVYVVINFIIIAIAVLQRYQQWMEERVSKMVASAKVQHTHIPKETYDVPRRKTSMEYKTDFGAMEPEMYGHLDINQKQSTRLEVNSNKKAMDAKIEASDFEVKPKKKPVQTMEARYLEAKMKRNSAEPKKEGVVLKPKKYENIEAKNLQVNYMVERSAKEGEDEYSHEVKPKKKPVQTMEAKYLEAKMKRNSAEPKKEVVVLKPKKYENIEATNLQVNYMMERSAKEDRDEYSHAKTEKKLNRAKEGEDQYSHAKMEKMPNRVNTIEIPMDYSPDERNVSNRFNYQEHDEETLQAGKEVSAAEGEEENDTLEGTWKMIMESRRLHEAALQQEASQMRSPSHSRKKQDTYNY